MRLWFSRAHYDDRLSRIQDHLYRISVDELDELLREMFQVSIVAGVHDFVGSVGKLGVAEKTLLKELPPQISERDAELRCEIGPVTLVLYRSRVVIRHSSKVFEYEIHFAGTWHSLQKWYATLRKSAEAYSLIFLYLFNRLRASHGIELEHAAEREQIQEISSRLRQRDSVTAALQQAATRAGFDWAVISVYGLHTQRICPIAASDDSLYDALRVVEIPKLLSLAKLAEARSDLLIENLDNHQERDCNCRLLVEKGARQACFLRFGADPLADMIPRGIISLYRRTESDLREADVVFLTQFSREIAAWVDEVDERLESGIIQDVIRLSERRCNVASSTLFDEKLFTTVLDDMGEAMSRHLAAAQITPRARTSVTCRFSSNQTPIDILQKLPFHDSSTSNSESQIKFKQVTNSVGAISCGPGRPGAEVLVVQTSLSYLTLLRTHVFESLFLLIELVYHLVGVERRRVSWIQRTIHEIRQPLQGLVAMASEIQRMASLVSVPRRKVAQYADDMETGILRLKVLLHIFNNIANIESVRPALRPCRIHADVVRPIQRMMSGHAKKRRVTITELAKFETVPMFRTDPGLLSIVFHNLLDNAIKYSPTNSEIRLTCGELDSCSFVEVSNVGPEIHQDEVARIFEDGFRGRNATATEVGWGLGLSMARKIASILDCRIELVSRGDGGADIAFRLYIPRELRE
jgi:hypothetical protein